MEQVTKDPASVKTTCDLATKPEIHLSIFATLTSLITKDTSELFVVISRPSAALKAFCFSLRREYPPVTLNQLQMMIDLNRLNTSRPIDVASLCATGIFTFNPDQKQFGFQLTDEGANTFKSKINIEVQHANELVIATIEKHGGVIRTAYYDPHALQALKNPKKWFEKGTPLPKRMIPPIDAIEYYSDPKNRGYLADPEAISRERLVLAQKYGYELPKIEDDPDFEMLQETKDPRQVFYGLEPGIVVNLQDKSFIKQKSN